MRPFFVLLVFFTSSAFGQIDTYLGKGKDFFFKNFPNCTFESGSVIPTDASKRSDLTDSSYQCITSKNYNLHTACFNKEDLCIVYGFKANQEDIDNLEKKLPREKKNYLTSRPWFRQFKDATPNHMYTLYHYMNNDICVRAYKTHPKNPSYFIIISNSNEGPGLIKISTY